MTSDRELFEDIDREMRAEALHAFWAKYNFIILTVVAACLIVGALLGVRHYYLVSRQEKASLLYDKALEALSAGDPSLAVERLNGVIAVGATGYTALADLKLRVLRANDTGGLLSKGPGGSQKDSKDMLSDQDDVLFKPFAGPGQDPTLGALGVVLAAWSRFDVAGAMRLTRALDEVNALEPALAPLTLEQKAFLALRTGQWDEARVLFEKLAQTPNAAELRVRAYMMAQHLRQKAPTRDADAKPSR